MDMDGVEDGPALQVIILGSGGGPLEDNTTALLVRSVAANWNRGSVLAVDAGVHLAAISKILEPFVAEAYASNETPPLTLMKGPFKGLALPHVTANANAAHITRHLVDTYLITHPHLDHISGFVVNTASLPGSRPKRLAGLHSTIEAFSKHIFNNVIWPNLSDEHFGAGLVTYIRLVEGGSLALGDGDGRGYMELCEGLSVKTWSVSHGHCMEKHSHRGSSAEFHGRNSHDLSHSEASPRRSDPTSAASQILSRKFPSERSGVPDRVCVYDSSAYFIRDVTTGKEVLIFGDVEPDSISLSPRNLTVWNEAAPKIAQGLLRGIFIECSYDDSQGDEVLFGHLAPRHLIQELKVLGERVEAARIELAEKARQLELEIEREKEREAERAKERELGRKRKRPSGGRKESGMEISPRRRSNRGHSSDSTPLKDRPTIVRMGSSSVSPHTRPQSTTAAPSRYSLDGNLEDSEIPSPGLPNRSLDIAESLVTTGGSVTPTSGNPNTDVDIDITDVNEINGEIEDVRPQGNNDDDSGLSSGSGGRRALEGLKIIIIHVKNKLTDAPPIGDNILRQLEAYEEECGLGCEFVISEIGMAVYL